MPTAPNICSRVNERPGLALVLALIGLSGNPVLTNSVVSPIAYVIVFAVVLRMTHGAISRKFVMMYLCIAGVFLIVFLGQLIGFGFVSLPACGFFLIKLLLGGLIVSAYGVTFIERYFHACGILASVSLACYAALLVTGPVRFPTFFPEDVIGRNVKSIGIFTVVMSVDWWRNSGMMWEPGAFQGVLNLAVFMVPTPRLIARDNRLSLIAVVAAILTTFSTTGYVVLFFIVLYKVSTSRVSNAYRIPMYVFAIALFGYAVSELAFLGEKVFNTIMAEVPPDEFAPDRYHALLFDAYYIRKSPFVGNGFHEITRFADHPYLQGLQLGHGNGLSNFIATVGLLGAFGYFAGLMKSAFGARKRDRLALVAIVGALAIGEQFLGYPLFLALPFIGRRRPQLRGPHAGDESCARILGTAAVGSGAR